MKWEIITEKSKDYVLELRGTDGGWEEDINTEKRKTIWNYHAYVKWDGCVHFSTYVNGYNYDHEHDDNCKKGVGCCENYIHICDLGDMMLTLLDLKKIATDYYQKHGHADDWPDDK